MKPELIDDLKNHLRLVHEDGETFIRWHAGVEDFIVDILDLAKAVYELGYSTAVVDGMDAVSNTLQNASKFE